MVCVADDKERKRPMDRSEDLNFPSLTEQNAFLQAKIASGDYMLCPACGGSWMPKKTCKLRQKQKAGYRYKADRAFAGEILYLECEDCSNNKTINKIRNFDNGAWRKTKRCEDRVYRWARGEGFETIVEAFLFVSGDIFVNELAKMCGVSNSFLRGYLAKMGIPRLNRSLIQSSNRRRGLRK